MSKTPALAIGVTRLLFWRQAFTSFFLFIILLFFWQTVNFNLGYALLTFAIALAGYLALLSAYQSLKIGRIGVVSPITSSSLAVTILFSVLFFGEILTIPQIASITAISLGIILLSIDFSDFKKSGLLNLSSGVPFALLACFIWGIVYSLYRIPIIAIGPIFTAFLIEFSNFCGAGAANLITKTKFALPDKKTFFWIFLIGCLAAASTLFYNLAVRTSQGDTSLVAAIVFSNPIISVLYGKFVYKEIINPKQWLSLALIIAGIVSISIF